MRTVTPGYLEGPWAKVLRGASLQRCVPQNLPKPLLPSTEPELVSWGLTTGTHTSGWGTHTILLILPKLCPSSSLILKHIYITMKKTKSHHVVRSSFSNLTFQLSGNLILSTNVLTQIHLLRCTLYDSPKLEVA